MPLRNLKGKRFKFCLIMQGKLFNPKRTNIPNNKETSQLIFNANQLTGFRGGLGYVKSVGLANIFFVTNIYIDHRNKCVITTKSSEGKIKTAVCTFFLFFPP